MFDIWASDSTDSSIQLGERVADRDVASTDRAVADPRSLVEREFGVAAKEILEQLARCGISHDLKFDIAHHDPGAGGSIQ